MLSRALTMASLSLALAVAAGCRPSAGGSVHARLQDDNSDVRIHAMVDAVRRNDQQSVALLVENLASEDSDVRLFASIALEKLTGQTMGYKYYEPRDDREKAVKLWRQWLRGGRKASATQATQATQATRPIQPRPRGNP